MEALSSKRFSYPFKSRISPIVDKVEEDRVQYWSNVFRSANSVQLPISDKIKESKLGYFVGRMFPDGDFNELCLAYDYAFIFIWLDDFIDSVPKGRKSEVINKFLTSSRNIFHLNQGVKIGDNLFVAELDKVWHRFTQLAQKDWLELFIKVNEETFQAFEWEARNHDAGGNPLITDYLQRKIYITGGLTLSAISLWINKIDLPLDMYYSSLVQELISSAMLIPSLANDIHSLLKEQESSEFNIVTLLKEEKGGSIEDAVKEAIDLHNTCLARFIELSRNRPSFGTEIDKELNRYISSLETIIAGYSAWATMDTARYQ